MKKLILIFIFINLVLFPSLLAKPQNKVKFPDDSADDRIVKYSTTIIKINSNKIKKGNVQQSNKETQFYVDSTKIPCKDTSMLFCERVNDEAYPREHVEAILHGKANIFSKFFNKIPNLNDSLQTRFMPTQIKLCDSYRRLIYPQLAKNVFRDWRFIINQPNYQQPIRVEICQRKSNQCLFNDAFPQGYYSSCAQKHMKVPLLSLGEDGEIVSYEYEFPSHCQCELYLAKN